MNKGQWPPQSCVYSREKAEKFARKCIKDHWSTFIRLSLELKLLDTGKEEYYDLDSTVDSSTIEVWLNHVLDYCVDNKTYVMTYEGNKILSLKCKDD